MSIYIHNGQILFRNGMLAKGPDCCCGGCPCNNLSDPLYAHTKFCGTSTVTLAEVAAGPGEVRAWEGEGDFGDGPGTAKFKVWCDATVSDIKFCFDVCTGGPPCGVVEEVMDCEDMPWEYTGVPPSACDAYPWACMEDFFVTISESPTSPY